MTPKRLRLREVDEWPLPFDVTQEIEPALVDEVLRSSELTLTQDDFADISIALPDRPKPRP